MRIIKKEKSKIKQFQVKESMKLKKKMEDANMDIWRKYTKIKNQQNSKKIATSLEKQLKFQKKRKQFGKKIVDLKKEFYFEKLYVSKLSTLASKFKDDLKAFKTEQRALIGKRLDESAEFISKV